MLKRWCALIITIFICPFVFALGSGTQADPFIVTSLTYEGQFVTNGVGHYVSPSININGVNYPSGWAAGKGKVISFSGTLINGKNTVSIQSNYGHADGCCWSAYCDYVLAAIRVGAAADNNVVYTQASGWSGTGIREYMESGGGCTFYRLEEKCEQVYVCNDWCGLTTVCNTVPVPVRVDMPYTTQEKCVNTATCGDCCQIGLSRDFWVKSCAASESCTTAGDENCNGQCDYDSSVCSHGDVACPVGVTAISVSSSTPTAGSSITVDCTSTVKANSIFASVDGVGDCTWQYWVNDNVARFSCNVGSTVGSRTVRCSVYATKSYQSGSDKTVAVNVLASDCSTYTSSSSCEADSRCDWCPQCVGVKYTGGLSRCVNANTCPAAYCWKGQCGATCDSTQGGCTSPSTCDLTTCSCVTNEITVGGYVRTSSGVGISNVYVGAQDVTQTGSCPFGPLVSRSATTDSSGYYSFIFPTVSSPCDWILITPSQSGCTFSPTNARRQNTGSNIQQDFTGTCCTDECVSGARQCSGNGYQICGNYDADSCLEWSSVTSCPSGQICSNGQCITSCTSNEVGLCRDNLDNDCDLESDYDSLDGRHGDSDCPVGVTAVSVSSSAPIVGSSITVGCTSSVANVNSVVASVDGVGLCSFTSWSGSVAQFSCNVGSTVGSRTVRCSVDLTKSYKSGSDQTTSINVLASTCSAYTTNSACEADSRCDWCPQCVGVKYTGGLSRCVNANTCPAAYCWLGQCGATCDPTNGGCFSPSICDNNLCSCSCVSCSENTCYNSTAVRSCTSGCLGAIINCASNQYCSHGQCLSCISSESGYCYNGLDDDCDGLVDCKDADCSYLGACSCSSPIPEVCNNGKDDDCDGLIDCVDSDCYSSSICTNCNAQCSKAICNSRSEVCNNGLDDDCDGNTDCVDSDCSSNLFCCVGDDCGCLTGTRLCADGVCRATCITDPVCSNNAVCDSGESCSCADCFSRKDSCKSGEICNPNTKHCECGLGLLPCIDGSCNVSCGECGDGVIDPGETCDGDVFPPDIGTCKNLGFDGGSLSCSDDCHFDTSACTDSSGVCGDGKRNVGEGCDGLDFGIDLDPDDDGCNILGFSGGVLDCTSDCKYDTSNCYDIPSCDSDEDCPLGAVCGVDGRCGCPGGTNLCSDGTCSDDCDSTDGGVKGCVVLNDVCEFGEGCSCADCDDGDRASCKLGSSCFNGVCSDCNLTSALWDVDNCAGNICVVANNSLVDLVAYGSGGCLGMSFKFRVWNDRTGEVVGYPSSAVFSVNKVTSDWVVFWKDVSGFLGLGSDDPLYNFFVRAVGVNPIDSANKLKVCDHDDDCDGILNLEDECSNTPLGENAKTDTPYKGCSPSQIECISQIDCSMVPWSECDASNQRTRKICKNPVTGEAFFDAAGDCCNLQSTCMCSLGSCSNRGSWIPMVRECLIEEDFPFFSTVNVLVVLSILICYYFFIQVRRKKIR